MIYYTMQKPQHLHPSDLQGLSRLAVDATRGMTDLVEATHLTIARLPGLCDPPLHGRTRGITGLVYANIRGVTRLVGSSLNLLLAGVIPFLDQPATTPQREALLAALNGVLGDHLVETRNPLAIPMGFRLAGQPLKLERQALAAAFPAADGRIVVLTHGLCMNDLQWQRQGHDHGAALGRDLGYTPVYLHYNSGLHISSNGAAFAALLEELLASWPAPVTELVILAHSMGGLLARSASEVAAQSGLAWLQHLRKIIFLGTPHSGSPLERGGHWIDRLLGANPYSAPFARLGRVRSAGIADLRHGSLRDSDWQGRDCFSHNCDALQPLPLPEGVAGYACAAVTAETTVLKDRLANDGLVPLASALGEHADPAFDLQLPAERKYVRRGIGHFDLLSDPEVYTRIKAWVMAG